MTAGEEQIMSMSEARTRAAGELGSVAVRDERITSRLTVESRNYSLRRQTG